MGVELVKADMTPLSNADLAELARCDMKNLPVNLLYPANYPEEPAIMLPEFISPGIALEALGRIAPETTDEETQSVTVEAANNGDQGQSNAG